MKEFSDNLKATFFLGVASFLTSGINYITTPIFTRIMSTSEFGLVSKYNSAYLMISVIATLTLSRPGILSVGLYTYKEERWKYLSTMLGEVLAASLVTFCAICLFWRTIYRLLNLPFSLMILMILCCAIQPAMTFWTYKQRYEYKWKSTFLVTVGTAIVAQFVSVAAVLWFKNHANYNLGMVRLISAAIINLIVSLVIYIYIVYKGGQFVNLPLWKDTLSFAVPLIPHYFGFALLTGIDKIMIGAMVGDDKTGIYSLAAVISTIGALVWQAMCVSVTPFVYESLGARQFRKIDSLTKPLLELIGFACVSISLLSPEIIAVMGTYNYYDAAYVVPAAAAGAFFHVLYDLFSNIAFFHKKSNYIMSATLVSATSNIVLNYIFIKRYGYIAAGYTTLCSYLILAILHYLISRIIEKETVFDWKYDLLLSAIVVLACLSSIIIFNKLVFRLFALAAIIVVVICRREKYFTSIREMKV